MLNRIILKPKTPHLEMLSIKLKLTEPMIY